VNQVDQQIALFGVEAAELVLHVDIGLLTQVEQVLALHVQFAGQDVNTHFVLRQAALPVLRW
jgi:hypothetical protein